MKTCKKDGFVFRKVVIPAALGDDVTGQDKPANGAYTNSYVEYEANGAQYLYDSYGIYTKVRGERDVATKNYVDTLIAALEARVAALEGNS